MQQPEIRQPRFTVRAHGIDHIDETGRAFFIRRLNNSAGLVSLIKKDPQLKSLPVMIVSYKDRDEDRQRGLEVGADYYLTKGSFQDETLLDAVADLIGQA